MKSYELAYGLMLQQSNGRTIHDLSCVCVFCRLGYTKDWLSLMKLDNPKPEVTPVEPDLEAHTAEHAQRTVDALAGALDTIHNPPHYIDGRAHQPVDVILDWKLSYALGNVVKYIARAGRKGDAVEDLKKARFYLDREISRLSEV